MTGLATLVLRNGRIYTVDEKRSWAQAMAVQGDRFVYVGDDEGVDEFVGPETEVIDAGGRLVLPGFIDCHLHTSTAYLDAHWANLGGALNFEEITERMRKHAAENPEDKIVGGVGWMHDAMSSRGHVPTKEDLDEIVSDRPIFMVSYDGWIVLANTRMTKLAEEALRDTSPRMGGAVIDPQSGEMTGCFNEPADLLYYSGSVSAMIRQKQLDGFRWIFDQLPKYGITGVQDAFADSQDIKAYDALRKEDGLKARAYIALGYRRGMSDEELRGFSELRSEFSDEWISVRAVKLFIDGVLDSHTGALLEPYADDPSSRGETKYDPEEFCGIVTRLDALGFQCWTHACGDRGVRVALDAYEAAARVNGRRDSRHRVEHIEFISGKDIPRFAELDVIASMQPIHAVPTEDMAMARAAGPTRMRSSFPWRSLDKSGARLVFSSDWSVADVNPLLGIHAAVTRSGEAGYEQSVSLEKAIQAYTVDAAYASFEEDIKGSIEVGKLADFVVISDNLFEIPAEDIEETKVVLTVLGGKELYMSPDF